MHAGTYDDDVLFTLSNINLIKPGPTHYLPLMFRPFTDSCVQNSAKDIFVFGLNSSTLTRPGGWHVCLVVLSLFKDIEENKVNEEF